MNKDKIIIDIGPGRSGTTYLWDLVVHNDLHKTRVRLNQPAERIEYAKELSMLPNANFTADFIALFNALDIKEDRSLNYMLHYATSGHPDNIQFNKAKWQELFYYWLHGLKYTQDKKFEETVYNHMLYPKVVMGFETHWDTEKYYKSIGHTVKRYNKDLVDWGDAEDWHRMDQSNDPLFICTPTLFRSGAFMDIPGMPEREWDTDRYNNCVTPQHALNMIEARQQYVIDLITTLSEEFNQVVVCMQLRNNKERINSALKLNRYASQAIGSILSKGNPDVLKDYLDNNYRMVIGRTNHLRQFKDLDATSTRFLLNFWINHLNYSSYSKLFTNKLPNNVELRTINTNDLGDANKLHNYLPEIFDADCDKLNLFGVKRNSENIIKFNDIYNFTINKTILDRSEQDLNIIMDNI